MAAISLFWYTNMAAVTSDENDLLLFFAFISEWKTSAWPPSIQMGVTAGIFLASILLKEMRYLVYIRCTTYTVTDSSNRPSSSRL
jgi:hypothetical protein